ncbi:MAG: exodeoxyribonuclease VII small subunit [Anaerolineae bacterium]|nr:exodeoxyribonuclease VII small subunit [Anaerolineae bacterium]
MTDPTPPADLDDLTFEQAYAELEESVARLESGDLTLDESVALYARGQTLARHCGVLLDAADLRVRQIGEDGVIED